MSYAEIAAKGPKQTPEEVSAALLTFATMISSRALYANMFWIIIGTGSACSRILVAARDDSACVRSERKMAHGTNITFLAGCRPSTAPS